MNRLSSSYAWRHEMGKAPTWSTTQASRSLRELSSIRLRMAPYLGQADYFGVHLRHAVAHDLRELADNTCDLSGAGVADDERLRYDQSVSGSGEDTRIPSRKVTQCDSTAYSFVRLSGLHKIALVLPG